MMLKLVKVLLYGRRIGTMSQFGDVIRFQPDPAYIADADRPVLTQQLVGESEQDTREILSADRDVRLVSTNGVLPPFFEHLLPEGPNAVRLARERNCGTDDQFELLVAAGHDLMGALEVVPLPADEVTEDVVARHASRGREPVSTGLVEPPLDDGFAIGGVQTKFSMVNDGRRYVIRKDGAAGSIIAKLPSTRHPDLVYNEWLAMRLVGSLGLEVVPVEIRPIGELDLPVEVPFTEYLHVPRFDRSPTGERLHMEEFAQLVNIRPAHKYAPLDQYVKAMRTVLRFSIRGMADFETCIRRQAAYALVGNTDAHLKNWAIRYTDYQNFCLAPAYDVVSITSFFGEDDNEYAINRKIDSMMREWDLAYFEGVALRAGVRRNRIRLVRRWVTDVVKQAETWPGLLKELAAPPGLAQHILERVASFKTTLLRG